MTKKKITTKLSIDEQLKEVSKISKDYIEHKNNVFIESTSLLKSIIHFIIKAKMTLRIFK